MNRSHEFTNSLSESLQALAEALGKSKPLAERSVELFAADQQWGSTALGFNLERGLAGAAMTTALTVVVMSDSHAAVCFGGSLAYVVGRNDKFIHACETMRLPSQREAIRMFGSIRYRGETHTEQAVASQDRAFRKEEELFLRSLLKNKA